MVTIKYRLVAVRSNWESVNQQVENFAVGFRCKAFQNTAGANIEAERPTATQKFCEWVLGKLAEDSLLYRKLAQ